MANINFMDLDSHAWERESRFYLDTYPLQVKVLHTLAEGFRQSDQWNTGLWLKFAAWQHDLLLHRNWFVGALIREYFSEMQEQGDDETEACIRAPMMLAEEKRYFGELDHLLEQDSFSKAIQSLKMIQVSNVWWRTNNLRLLLSHHPEPTLEPEKDPRRAFQHVTLYNMFELVPDDWSPGYRPSLYEGKSADEEQEDLALRRKLASQFDAPEVFLNEKREAKLKSRFAPPWRRAGQKPYPSGPGAWRECYELYLLNESMKQEMAHQETERGVWVTLKKWLRPTDKKTGTDFERTKDDESAIESPSDEATAIDEVRRTPHMDVSATIPIPPGAEFQVEVFADREQARSGELAEGIRIAAPAEVADFQLNVWLFTSAHFEVVNRPLDKLHIQRQKSISNRVAFTVRAKTVDELAAIQDHLLAFNRGSITAAFSYEGRPCGRVGRIIQLDVEEQYKDALDDGIANRTMVPKPRTGLVIRHGEEPPDMLVEIKANEDDDEGCFHCKVTTCLEETSKEWKLKKVTSEIVRSYMDNFTEKGKTKPQLIAALKGAGKNLFRASPKIFQEAFWRLMDNSLPPKSIQVNTEEPHFLWELMIPTRSGEEREPLGVEFTMARWVTGNATSPYQQIPITDSYVIAPAYTNTKKKLRHAEAESKMVCKKFKGEPIKPASYENIRESLQAKKVSLLHFACHGEAKDNDVEQSLLLADDGKLTLIELEGDDVFKAYFGIKKPFVFLNACEVGRQQATLSGAGGFPAVLIELGARAVVAPAWSVKDTIAHKIAKDFYNQMEKHPEKPFAAILREIRKLAYDKGEDTYAAYCFYGDPLAVRL